MKHLLSASIMVLMVAGCGDKSTEKVAEKITEKVTNNVLDKVVGKIANNPNKNAYFGDLHIHTKNSFDAYIFNVRSTPDDVYRFAKGESVRHPSGFDIKIGGEPLDFVAATDHGAYMGILPAMDTKGHPLNSLEMAQDMFGQDIEKIGIAFRKLGASVRNGIPYPEVYDRDIIDSAWQNAIDAANNHYEPGKLTTFAAYEFTAVKVEDASGQSFNGGNLHRNVVFEDAAPNRLFSTLDSINPEDLWTWMDGQRASGRDVLAIPHNSNVSDGAMFDMMAYDGSPLTAEMTQQRIINEPLVEITQVKGTSETHPALSPNDEWADFEIYEYLISAHVKSKITGGFVREALANGFALEADTGTNPYKFGLIGSSDTHVAGGAFDEQDYWSKIGIVDGTPEARGSVPPGGAKTWEGVARDENAEHWFSRWGASGLAGVWSEENTRESIFAAMKRKETFATSGTRIQVRMFGGYDLDAGLVNDADMTAKAYKAGVPMGGDLSASQQAPDFLVWAVRDPRGAPLQRLQMVKSWHEDGKAQEAVYDIACSDGASPDSDTHRCADNGASVNLEDCSISTDRGDSELKTVWRDPDFTPGLSTAYYVRVLENPTCRWSTWDAMRAGVERHPDLPPTLQERAWTSPIWYNAGG